MANTMTGKPILEMKGITKYIFDAYGHALRNATVKILDNVDFDLYKGEVHILVGENGAGKSTLMKVLGGILPPDEGTILLDGKPVSPKNAREAMELGIGFIHQEYDEVCEHLYSRGLEDGFVQELSASDESYIPLFDLTGVRR